MEQKGKSELGGKCSACRCKEKCGARAVGVAVDVSATKCREGGNVGMMFDKPKMCRCGRGHCKILTSGRPHSFGRRFYCCPESSGADNHGCGMFEWVIESERGTSSSRGVTPALNDSVQVSSDTMCSTTLYARGYLDGAIRGSEQQTHALKNILDALKKLDVNEK